MFVEWTSNIKDPEEKANFERIIWSSKPVLERIQTILKEKLSTIDRSETDIRTYEFPNWENRQAHKNGQRDSLAFLIKLVDLDQQRIQENDRK